MTATAHGIFEKIFEPDLDENTLEELAKCFVSSPLDRRKFIKKKVNAYSTLKMNIKRIMSSNHLVMSCVELNKLCKMCYDDPHIRETYKIVARGVLCHV